VLEAYCVASSSCVHLSSSLSALYKLSERMRSANNLNKQLSDFDYRCECSSYKSFQNQSYG
jgi:hypothetical protein